MPACNPCARALHVFARPVKEGLHAAARGACVLFALAPILLGACASAPAPDTRAPAAAPAPPPAAVLPRLIPTEPPSDLGVAERFAWQRVTEYATAFTAGDTAGFMDRVSRGFYRGYTTLENSLKELVVDSTERAAVIAVQRISSEDGRVTVRARWTRSVTRRDGTVQNAAGETEFLFLKSDTSLRLLDYRGDPPFGIPGI